MIDQTFKTFITQLYPLTDEELQTLQKAFTPRTVEKKDFLLKEGQFTQSLFFIKSGIFRGFYVSERNEITYNFSFGPTFFADIVSIVDKTSTTQNLQALEGGEVWEANIRNLESLGDDHPAILKFFVRFYENVLAFNLKRQLSMINDTAEERYRKLIKERPRVISELPLAYIASYLGIKPESLSRIRRRIMIH